MTLPILIVEDSPTQLLRLRLVLENEGFEVATAPNGANALAWLKAHRARMVVSDVMMPEMNGFELCAAIKGDPVLSHTPVVLLTTLTAPSDVVRGLESGADSFLGKPYDPEAMLRTVRRILAHREFSAESAARPGIELHFGGQRHFLDVNRVQIIDMLLSSFGTAVDRSNRLARRNRNLEQAIDRIRELEANHRAILESSADAMLVTDEAGVVRYANGAAVTLLERPRDALLDAPLPFAVAVGSALEVQVAGLSTARCFEVRACALRWEGQAAQLVTARDVTELVEARKELEEASLRDPLTGLYNRRGFETVAEECLRLAQRQRLPVTLAFIDLDDMKGINDVHGHDAGDAALVAISALLEQVRRRSDVLGRIGGDEFVLLLHDADEDGARLVADRLQGALARHNATSGVPWDLAASVGHATRGPGTDQSLDALQRAADTAMYLVKQQRKRVARDATPGAPS